LQFEVANKTTIMMSSSLKQSSKVSPVEALSIQQAMVALELGASDDYLLRFFDFFNQQVPVASTHFLHVLPAFDAFNSILKEEGSSLISNFEINDEVLAQMKAEVDERLKKTKCENFSLDIREGDPLEELLKDATKVNPDLIFIGQKSRTSEHGILAKNLARRTSANAMIVPEGSSPEINTILVPIDFSSYSIKALRMAVALKKQLGADTKIVCVNVYQMPDFSVYRIQKTLKQLKKMIQADHQEAFKAFINTHLPEEADTIDFELIQQEEPGIAHYLVDSARKLDADLIIMGAKGYSKVELLLMGSVTEKLLALNSSIPTLIVK
jgi:nucleotide-binding universal stress UspA family protein